MNWLNYSPVVYVRDWPTGYDAAAVIAPSLTEDVNNIRNLFSILKSEKVNATFFVNPETANSNAALIKELPKYGEVAALVDIGYLSSINDTVNSLNDYDTQLEKFGTAKNILETVSNSRVTGALPYFGLFDQNSIKSLIDAGYNYVLTDSLTDRSVPKTIIRGEDRFISMTKTARDDYEVIRDFGLKLPEFQRYTYQEDIDRVLFEGGMYVMKMHTEFQCKPENVGVIKDLIKDLKRKKIWIATAAEIQNWYARRNYIETRIERRGDRRIAITVSNPGKSTLNELVVQVDMNDKASNIAISSEIIGTKKARYRYDSDTNILYVFIDDLKKGESRTYYIDYDKPNV